MNYTFFRGILTAATDFMVRRLLLLPPCSVRLWTEIRVEEGSWVERNVTHEMWIKTLPS